MRHCLMLDLKDDVGLIAEYEAHHRAVWPEVEEHLRSSGVVSMDIWRLGTRLCMVMETDDAVFDPQRMAQAAEANESVRAWEQLMWRFQAPTPWTPQGGKWTAAECIFEMRLRI
jgi:L-rhamnose mutarotase